VALAQRLDHPVYDCFYVALAQRERARLLTFDERLVKKLTSASLERLLR
jgi:predicted nucleic acid-binding protein